MPDGRSFMNENMSSEEAEKKEKLFVTNIDDVLPYIGEFGRFQILLEVLFCVSQLPVTYQVLLPYFVQDNPTWKCVSNSSSCYLPGELNAVNDFRCNLSRSEWIYTTPKDYSIATQFDLQCSKKVYLVISTSTFFISWAVGAVFLGWLSDRYGRFKILLLSEAIVILSGFISAFSPNFAFYAFIRTVIGFFIPGVVVPLFVIASEIVGSKYRPLTGVCLWAAFGFGLIFLGTLAYFIRQWKYLIIVSTAPYIPLLIFYKFVPESIRWLRISGRSEEAMMILQKIAKFNHKEIPGHLCLTEEKKIIHVPLLDIFRPKKMAFSTLIQGYMWMIEAMVYYGVTLAADDLGGSNRYVNYILSSLIDFPSALTAFYLCGRIGRKKTVGIPLFIGSVLCIIVAFIPSKRSASVRKHWPMLRVAVGLIGKYFATVSFDAIYTWSAEIYPTVVRAEALGYLQIKSRIGAALAPWVTKWLIIFHSSLPFLVMGGASFIASFFALWLPETRDLKTAETLERSQKDDFPPLMDKEGKLEMQPEV